MPPSADIDWPDRLDDDFEFIEHLATGRMSTVVRACHRRDDRVVALKLLHDHLADEMPVRRRLRREFAAVRRLDHPAVVRAYDLIEDDDFLALVFEFVDAPTVRQQVEQRGPLRWEEAKPIIDDLLAALQQAHDRGIWHRDLNAEHVFADGDSAKIAGFGLARVDELVALTMHTQTLGNLEAMAPERVLGMEYDGRADLYSVGAVAYEMLVGHPPTGSTMQSAFENAADARGAKFDELPDDLPAPARYLLERSLVADPSARFATASQMRRAIEGIYDEQMWMNWASRESKNCPGCTAPVIDGVDTCIDCDYEFQRLIQQPGEGQWYVQVISPREAFDPDVWFERNDNPDHLPSGPYDALLELLDTHEDTRHITAASLDFRWPPYILFEQLTSGDAHRIAQLLDERDIPHRLLDEPPSRLGRLRTRARQATRFDAMTEQAVEDWRHEQDFHYSMPEYRPYLPPRAKPTGPGAYLWALPVVLISNLQSRHMAMLVLSAGILSLLGVLVSDPLGAQGFAAAAAAFGLGWLAATFGVGNLTRRICRDQERKQLGGQPVMASTEQLQRIELDTANVKLPAHTSRILGDLQEETVRRDVQELLVLGVAVARRVDAADADAFESLIDEVLAVARRLDQTVSAVDEKSTAEIHADLQTCQKSGDTEARRDKLLEQLDQHDRAVLETTRLRSQLQRLRGTLLDMMVAPRWRTDIDDPVVFEFENAPEEALMNLQTLLESRQEIDQLVAAPETT